MGWLPPIIPLLAVILLLGSVKRKTLLLPLVLKLSTELRFILLLKCYGFILSFKILVVV